jgi:ABC-type uncharacterized transport system permease subunit
MGDEMASRRLIAKALIYNMDAHRANPVNLVAGALGMIINNVIFLAGMWGMLFAGKPMNDSLLPYYIALNAIVMISWGSINFFFGGLRSLGEMITEGSFESMLATPRSPILLAGISRSHPIAFGDLLMGVTGAVFLCAKVNLSMGLRCFVASGISVIAFSGLFILAGALAFFVPRGNKIGHLVIEMVLSLSAYPTGKIFSGAGRIVLLLTPAAVTAVLPVEAVEASGGSSFALAFVAALAFFMVSLGFFKQGIKRYRALSLISAQGSIGF